MSKLLITDAARAGMETHPDITERLTAVLGERLVIERELGGGGMSRVFVAHEAALHRRVVVKVLPDELATVLSRERFRREILTSATLQHPNIVSVLSAGDVDGLLYFVMPYVDGESLRVRLERDGALPPVPAVSIVRDIARALAFAHERGVVHRDIKPDNVLLSGGTAVVADFGVAKAFATAREGAPRTSATLTAAGMSLGTPAYMAPEQVVGESGLDARTDLYALGAVAYEMLRGRPVFPRANVAEVLRAHLTDVPESLRLTRPGIPPALEAAVLRCLAKDPAQRPQSAIELLTMLDDPAVVSGAFVTTGEMGAGRPSRRPVVWLGVAALVVATAIGGASLLRREAPTGTAARSSAPTIAVLPFVSVSPDSADHYLAFGVTDEIISALARVPGIRVASRSAAEEGQRERLSLAQLSQRLSATHALEGTIQRSGRNLRVAVRLLSTQDGLTAWSEVFDDSTQNLLDVQRFIARAVAEAVQQDFGTPIEPGAAVTGHQPPAEAHDAWLRAHYELARRGEGNLTGAVDLLRRAVTIDSEYAVAWAELAQAYTVLPLYGQGGGAELQAEAMGAARRALSIDSMLPAAHAALGNLYNAQWRWQDGAAALQRAITLDPSYAPAQQWFGENRLLNGQPDLAERALAQAVRLDSSLSVARALHGIALALLHRPAAADSELTRAISVTPSVAALHVMRGTAMLYAGRNTDAVRELEVARVLDPKAPLVLGALGFAYARAGDRTGATAVEQQLTGVPPDHGAGGAKAKIRLGFGDTTSALDLLEQALRARDPLFASEPLGSPIFDAIRGSDRFARIIEAAGLDRRLARR